MAHVAPELAGAAADRAEKRPLGIAAQAGAVEIRAARYSAEVVVTRHRMPLAAFLTQPCPKASVLGEHVFDRHAERGDADERNTRSPDQRAVAKADMR